MQDASICIEIFADSDPSACVVSVCRENSIQKAPEMPAPQVCVFKECTVEKRTGKGNRIVTKLHNPERLKRGGCVGAWLCPRHYNLLQTGVAGSSQQLSAALELARDRVSESKVPASAEPAKHKRSEAGQIEQQMTKQLQRLQRVHIIHKQRIAQNCLDLISEMFPDERPDEPPLSDGKSSSESQNGTGETEIAIIGRNGRPVLVTLSGLNAFIAAVRAYISNQRSDTTGIKLLRAAYEAFNQSITRKLFAVGGGKHKTVMLYGQPKQRTQRTTQLDDEKAFVAAYYIRLDNAEPRYRYDGQHRVYRMYCGRKTVAALHESYKQERIADGVQSYVSRSTFYRLQPTDFKAAGLDTCVCEHCRKAGELVTRMRLILTQLKSHAATSEAKKQWTELVDDCETLLRHIMYGVGGLTKHNAHPLPPAFDESKAVAATVQRKRTIQMLAADLRAHHLPHTAKTKLKLAQRLEDHKVAHGPTGCAECDKRAGWFKRLTEMTEALTFKSVQYEGIKLDQTALKDLYVDWENTLVKTINHKYETVHQAQAFTKALYDLAGPNSDGSTIVICFDYSTGIRLHQSSQATQQTYMQTAEATAFGIVSYRRGARRTDKAVMDAGVYSSDQKSDGSDHKSNESNPTQPNWEASGFEVERSYDLFLSESTGHDAFGACTALDLFLQQITATREIKKIVAFSDNGSGFHTPAAMDMCESLCIHYDVKWESNFFAPGEGKNDNDR